MVGPATLVHKVKQSFCSLLSGLPMSSCAKLLCFKPVYPRVLDVPVGQELPELVCPTASKLDHLSKWYLNAGNRSALRHRRLEFGTASQEGQRAPHKSLRKRSRYVQAVASKRCVVNLVTRSSKWGRSLRRYPFVLVFPMLSRPIGFSRFF